MYFQSMSKALTFEEAKQRFANLVTTEVSIGDAIQEVIERAYEMGRWRGMMEEVVCNTNPNVRITENTEKQEVYIDFNPDAFDGAIGFRYGGKGYGIKTLVSLYQEEESTSLGYFVDIGDIIDADVVYRRYRAPKHWSIPTGDLTALMKKVAPYPMSDSDIVPIKSLGALKAGILAVAYENVNDAERSELHWQKFVTLMERAQKQYNGARKIYIRMNDGLKKRPTQFR